MLTSLVKTLIDVWSSEVEENENGVNFKEEMNSIRAFYSSMSYQ